MPEDIDRTIYKLELDDSSYIRGIDSMAASTARLTEQQQRANQTLQTNQAALKNASDVLKKAKQDLDNYTGTNLKYQQQLQKDFENAQADQKKLTDLVALNQKAYEQATKAALDFADVSARANKLQTTTGGGKIPTGSSLTTPIPELPKIDFTNLSGLPQILAQVSGEFKKIADAVELAKQKVAELSEQDPEFERLTEFIKLGEAALQKYNEAVTLASESTDELSQRIAAAQVTISKINTTNVEELPVEIAKSAEQFNELADAVALADLRLKEMKPTDTGFDELAKIVAQGKKTLQDFDTAAKNATGGQTSLRTQLRLAREELVRLEQAGKGASKEYLELEQRTAKLTDQFNDQQARIRILASDTKLLDFGKGAIIAATSAFQAYTSVAILAGDQSEDLQKKTMQLFAAMQLLQSLEQLSNLTRREGILSTLGLAGATKVYQAVIGTTTGALKAFRIALLATGIGAAVVAIGFLIDRYSKMKTAIDEAAKRQKILDDVLKEAGNEYSVAIKNVNELRTNIDLAKQGFISKTEVVKQYNETIGKTTGQVNSLNEAETALNKNADAYIQFTLLKASANITLTKAAEKAVEAQIQQRKDEQELTELQKGKGVTAGLEPGNIEEQTNKIAQAQQEKRIANLKVRVKNEQNELIGIATDFQKQAAEIAKKFNFNFFQDTKVEKATKKREIENVFDEERAKLNAELEKLRADELNDFDKINKEFATKLQVEQIRIAKLFKEKKVTADQEKILLNLAVEVNTAELNKAIEAARKKIEEARQKLNDQLKNLQSKATLDSINLLQDDFERRKQLIDFNEAKEIEDQKQATEERLKDLDEERRLKLITEEDYQKARQIIVTTGEQELNLIIQKFSQERQDLAADIFRRSLEAYTNAITAADLIRDQDLAAEVTKQAARFEKGKISFETFQRNITRFQRQQEAQRRAGELQVLNDELADLDRHLAAIKDTNSKEFADTKATRDKLAGTIAQKTVEDKTKSVTDKNTIADERTKQILSYSEAVGQLADSVIKFWQQANEAEQKALDRSIAIQQRRVDEAQKIAERGNATYLKQETDRLKELQIARENAARRQLAIDAALQASQLLVAITGAIAKIATPGIGVAEVIGEIAVIVGALATGFGLVRSLQGNQPKFRHGTTEVKRGKHPSGTDTIPAWLDEGEAVIPKKTNKKYKKTVEAIYHEKIPAEEINEFVTNYTKNNSIVNRNISNVDNNSVSNKLITGSQMKFLRELHTIKPIPQPNYEKIKEINEIKISHDGKLAKIMQEHSEKLDKMLKVLDTRTVFKTDVHYDAEGLAVRQKEIMDQMEKNRKL